MKSLTQDYVANELQISQRAYSKIECNETKLNLNRIEEISKILEIDPIDLINFNDRIFFNNSPQSGNYNAFNNNLTEKIIDLYEKRFADLEEDIKFLKEFIINKK